MLRRIKISGYKSLRDVEIQLTPLTVLFGPNAAGKSNFLDALQLLSRIVSSRNLKEAFDPPYRGTPLESFSFGADGLPGLIAKESASFSIEADIELSNHVVGVVERQIREIRQPKDTGQSSEVAGKEKEKVRTFITERVMRYRIEVEVLPKSGGLLRVADEYLTALSQKTGEPKASRKPFLERMGKKLHLRMEGQAHPIYYDRYLDHSILSLPLYPPHYPHLVAARQELASWLFFYFEPRERMRAPNAVREVRHIGLMGEELAAFLNTMKALDQPQFRAVEKSLQLIVPSVTGIEVSVNPLGQVDLKLKEGDTAFPASIISEGTLRILGMLALVGAKEPPALIGFEEPENGIHPRRIRMIAELLKSRAESGGTQTIVTTHSPLLPDLIPNQYLFAVRKEAARTEILPFTTWGELAKRGDIDDALDENLPPTTVSERILRGDFDA